MSNAIARLKKGITFFFQKNNMYSMLFNHLNPANIRLGEDVLKTYWRHLQDVFSVTFFCLLRRLEDVLKTSWRHNCKTSCKHVLKTSWKRLEDVLKRSWKTKCVTLKTSWRRLRDALENKKCLHLSILFK